MSDALKHLTDWLDCEPKDDYCTVSWMKTIAKAWEAERIHTAELEEKHTALEDSLREPTKEMLEAARGWSHKKYGKSIGNDAARGCLNAMTSALLGKESE